MDTEGTAQQLLALHHAPEILVLPNVWDVVSARAVADAPGVRAIATASHSIAASFGYPDGEQIPQELHLDMVQRITAAVHLPITMDMEAGYGDPAQTVRSAIAAGAVGGNLEDAMLPFDDAVAAVRSALAAARAAGVPSFVLNARTDALLRPDPRFSHADRLAEAIRRGAAYLEAGAPVVFIPRLVAPDDIAAVVGALGVGHVSIILIPGITPTVADLEKLGVARASTGPFTQQVALTALQDAAAALTAGGNLPAGTRPLN